ncbi:MAG: hypothetical protein PUB99_00420, partial [Oscillospiraceae bacterium]|nr:hypothetical protein [Oscillospiraceae bacterium]
GFKTPPHADSKSRRKTLPTRLTPRHPPSQGGLSLCKTKLSPDFFDSLASLPKGLTETFNPAKTRDKSEKSGFHRWMRAGLFGV